MKPELSIIVPCYNEEKNIPILLERFGNAIGKENIELILVNNGSTDNTSKLLKKLLPQYHFARTTAVKVNQGYGYGILSGLKAAKGEFLCWTHADLQTDPADTIKAYGLIKLQKNPKKTFIKGNRKKRPCVDSFFTFGMSVFESVILRKIMFDINAQPSIFHRTFFEQLQNIPHDFSFDLYFYYMAKKKNYRTVRFPVIFPERIHGESSWNTSLKQKWKFIKRTIDFTLKLKKSKII